MDWGEINRYGYASVKTPDGSVTSSDGSFSNYKGYWKVRENPKRFDSDGRHIWTASTKTPSSGMSSVMSSGGSGSGSRSGSGGSGNSFGSRGST